MAMSNKIEAQERNLASVFSDAYEFEIPPYQGITDGKRIAGRYDPTRSLQNAIRGLASQHNSKQEHE